MTWLLAALLTVTLPPQVKPHARGTCGDVLAFQVLLDRRGFSPGEIDGRGGPNLRRALIAFQEHSALAQTGRPDCRTWQALRKDSEEPVLREYRLTDDDLSGPFLEGPLPGTLIDQAALPSLDYASLVEALAERFHAAPSLITRLNPRIHIVAGTTVRVPAVTPFNPAQRPPAQVGAGAMSIVVSKRTNTLRVTQEDGAVVFVAPVSSGSAHDPLPIGAWTVKGTAWLPPFHYNPDLFWDADAADTRATIKPGPNNPVGVVWIDIDVPHYGLHGTPSPELVGHAQSHGCVRLTNWDAARLASLVKPGTRVEFVE